MKRSKLAKALRARQAQQGLTSKKVLGAISDAEILAAYGSCARCRGPIFADAASAVRISASTEEFLQLVKMALAAHVCERPPVERLN